MTDFERMLNEPSETLARLANTTCRTDEEKRLIEIAQAIRAMGDNASDNFIHPIPPYRSDSIFEFILYKDPCEIERLYNAAIHRKDECSFSMMIVALGDD